jgi:hypothetical protein
MALTGGSTPGVPLGHAQQESVLIGGREVIS